MVTNTNRPDGPRVSVAPTPPRPVKRHGESSKSRRAFERYCELGPQRSLKPPAALGRDVAGGDWPSRRGTEHGGENRAYEQGPLCGPGGSQRPGAAPGLPAQISPLTFSWGQRPAREEMQQRRFVRFTVGPDKNTGGCP